MSSLHIEIARKQPRAFLDTYLVRGVATRAIDILVPSDSNGTRYSDKLTEFEMYLLLVACSKYAKTRNWKNILIKIGYWDKRVVVSNFANCEICIGILDDFIDSDHFLNDDYYSPKGFWIKSRSSKPSCSS